MAKIALSSGYSLVPEGTHVFKITDVKYKEAFGKMEIYMETANGTKHIERFSLLNKDGTTNDGAMSAFSYLAKTALGDFDLTEIDHKDLIGHYFECEVTHDEIESNKTPGKMLKFVRLGDKTPSDGFKDAPAAEHKEAPKTSATPKKKVDLSALLG